MGKERIYQDQQMMWLPERGLSLLLPPQATHKIGHALVNGKTIPSIESARLGVISSDGILRKRYPSPENGDQFMQTVDYSRRDVLLQRAQNLTSKIVEEWEHIDPNNPICVVLFGSVAKGLVKGTDNSDPSNIDLTVIGTMADEQKEQLLNAIRPYRNVVKEENLSECSQVNTQERNPGNAGVMIQHVKKVRNGEFGPALNYISSGAFALHNPEMWQEIEKDALEYQKKKNEEKERQKKTQTLCGDLYIKPKSGRMQFAAAD